MATQNITLTLTSYNTGFDTEADFDQWTSHVASRIDDMTGLDVTVEQTRFANPGSFEDAISGATEEQAIAIREAVRALWWDVCAIGVWS